MTHFKIRHPIIRGIITLLQQVDSKNRKKNINKMNKVHKQ